MFKSVGAGVDIVVAIVWVGARWGVGVLVVVCERVCRGCLFWFLFTMILLLLLPVWWGIKSFGGAVISLLGNQ